jgi:glycine hydroxymethyltransferase
MAPAELGATPSATADRVRQLLVSHAGYRADCLNLIASENVISPTVAAALAGDLEGRYADFTGTDLQARKYRGGRYVVELESLCSELVCEMFGAEACELRAISGHVAGAAVLLALCKPGDLVMEVGQEGGGHRLAAKLAQASLVDLEVEFLPFEPSVFNVDAEPAAERIRTRRPRLVVLGSSSFVRPHPVRELAAACRQAGTTLVYDASHVMGLLAAGRFQDPLREGADLVFGSTHKTLCGPQGGLIFGQRSLVEQAAAGLYPPLVTNHHPFRLPALTIALCEHAQFGAAYADQTVENANAFADALAEDDLTVVGAPTQSHTVLLALPGQSGAAAAVKLEQSGVISNQTRLPNGGGQEGLRFGLQELTRRGGTTEQAAAAGHLVAQALSGAHVAEEVRALAKTLDKISFTWESV